MAWLTSPASMTGTFATDGEDIAGPQNETDGVGWLFEARGRRPPVPRFNLYLTISALGAAGYLGLLMASTLLQEAASYLRPAALVWFLLFGAFRISMFRQS